MSSNFGGICGGKMQGHLVSKQEHYSHVHYGGICGGNLRDPWWEIKADYQSKFLVAFLVA